MLLVKRRCDKIHVFIASLVQRDNKHMRDTILKLEQENEYLTRELVGSKAGLREEMDKVSGTKQSRETGW